jgi:exonuclease VII large subunit
LGILLWPQLLSAQACKDEESMADYYKKDLAGLVATVKKESLLDFERAYHQKSSLTKLTLYGSTVDGLLRCLDKAAQDPTATKEEADAYKAKREAYAKLKDKIQQDRNALKATEAPKDAKALIEKFDFAG